MPKSKDNDYVKTLKLARKILKSTNREFVCSSIVSAGALLDCYEKAEELQRWVQKSLDGHFTVGYWLEQTLNIDIGNEYPNPVLKDYRIRWIDNMIEAWRDHE